MILVTGATGLLGSNLLYKLASENIQVKALVRKHKANINKADLFSCFANFDPKFLENITWVEGDLLDYESIVNALEGVSYVYHCAGFVSFYERDAEQLNLVNYKGAENLINACLQENIKKLVHVSSIAALDLSPQGAIIDEKNAKLELSGYKSKYALSKLNGEREAWRGIAEGLNTVIVNPGVILGTDCNNREFYKILKQNNLLFRFYARGSSGYVSVKDVANAMILLMNSDVSNEQFVLVAENISVKDLVEKIANIVNSKGPQWKINTGLLKTALFFEKLTHKKPLLSKDLIHTLTLDTKYSSEKFIKLFNYKFSDISIEIKEMIDFLSKKAEKRKL